MAHLSIIKSWCLHEPSQIRSYIQIGQIGIVKKDSTYLNNIVYLSYIEKRKEKKKGNIMELCTFKNYNIHKEYT